MVANDAKKGNSFTFFLYFKAQKGLNSSLNANLGEFLTVIVLTLTKLYLHYFTTKFMAVIIFD